MIVPFSYRPFDLRWLYWEPETKLLDRNRPEYFPHVFEGNIWLAAVPQNRKEFNPPLVSPYLCSLHVIERGATLFPLRLRPRSRRESLNFESESDRLNDDEPPQLNLSAKAIEYLSRIDSLDKAENLFYHIVAILHSPAYASEHGSALRQNWPRIPLPDQKEILLGTAKLGRHIVKLLNTETDISGITSGKIREELRLIAKISRSDSEPLHSDTGDLEVNANWGYRNQEGAIMPGRGKAVEREYTEKERASIQLGSELLGLSTSEAFVRLGETTYDVYLNEVVAQ
jgi:hypothetical protein